MNCFIHVEGFEEVSHIFEELCSKKWETCTETVSFESLQPKK